MSQETNKRNERRPQRFDSRPPGGDDPNQAPKKGPRFSIYWIYAIIFAVLIGFQLFSPLSPNSTEIDQDTFEAILKKGDIKEYKVISNRNLVRVTIKNDSIYPVDAESRPFFRSLWIISSRPVFKSLGSSLVSVI